MLTVLSLGAKELDVVTRSKLKIVVEQLGVQRLFLSLKLKAD